MLAIVVSDPFAVVTFLVLGQGEYVINNEDSEVMGSVAPESMIQGLSYDVSEA